VYKAYGSLCVFAINDDVADALCSAEILWKFMDPPLCVCKKILLKSAAPTLTPNILLSQEGNVYKL